MRRQDSMEKNFIREGGALTAKIADRNSNRRSLHLPLTNKQKTDNPKDRQSTTECEFRNWCFACVLVLNFCVGRVVGRGRSNAKPQIEPD